MSTGAAGVAVIAGYGRGISKSVAARFGELGFKLALVSRTQSKLDSAASEFTKCGWVAKGFAADLGDEAAVKATIASIQSELGPVTVILWNPYGIMKGLLETSQAEMLGNYSVDVIGLIAAVQASYEDLKAQSGKSAILVTGGGMAAETDRGVEMAITWGAVSTVTSKAAQRKLVHIMNKQLGAEGIYAFMVTVASLVKGTDAADRLDSAEIPNMLEPDQVAELYQKLYTQRDLSVWDTLLGYKY